MRLLVSAMRQAARSVEAAELAVRHRDEGVVGFDIAGPEAGYPAHAAPRRVPADPAGELPLHDPRRRELRPAVDLGGAPDGAAPSGSATASGSSTTSRCRLTARSSSAAWPRLCATGACRSRCAPPPTSRRERVASIEEHPDRPSAPPPLPRHGQHRQPADERRDRRARSSRRSPRPSGSGSTRWSG